MIEVKNITKIYGKKQNAFVALDNVSFTIPDGVSVAILGKSGSGKSTLMHLMSGLDTPTSGSIIIDDRDLANMKRKDIDEFRAKKISFIFQSFFVQGNETSASNVSLPLEIGKVPISNRQKMIEVALEMVGLSDKIKAKAKDLSGGQKQRLAIARAIVDQPKIIFADEPTGNLDSSTGAKIEEILFAHNKKSSDNILVIVTHDIELAKKCDIQILIKDGKIVKIIKSNRILEKESLNK